MATSVTQPVEAEWKLPDRGTVGIISLILTEISLFSIFVIAYLFYIGKSLTGPFPKDVLEFPMLGDYLPALQQRNHRFCRACAEASQNGGVQTLVGRHSDLRSCVFVRNRSSNGTT